MLADEVGEVDSYGGGLIPIIDILFGEKNNPADPQSSPDRRPDTKFFKEQ